MKNVVFLAPIDYMTGKLPMDGNSAGTVLGLTAKHYKNNAKGSIFNGLSRIGVRKSDASDDELANRTKFAGIAALVAARYKNATKRIQDQQAFEAQSTYKTLKEYVWSVCTTEWNAAHPAA